MNDYDFNSLKNVPGYSLTERERAAMRERLAALEAPAPRIARPVPSPFASFLLRPFPVAAFALILAVFGGALPMAAAGSLPGDALYPVKVAFNERVELALAPSTEAKAGARVRIAEERLRETAVLAARGDLGAEVADKAAAAVALSIGEAAKDADALEEGGDAASASEIRGRIRSALRTHAEILSAQSEALPDESRARVLAVSVAASVAADEAGSDEGPGLFDDRAARRLAAAAKERAKERLEELEERLRENGIPDESETELALEAAMLAGEYEGAEGLIEADDYANARAAYEGIDDRAYRALAILRSAQAISDKTEKEVVIVLDRREPVAARGKAAAGAEEAAAMTMSLMAAPDEAADAANDLAEAREPESILEFIVRDRIGTGD